MAIKKVVEIEVRDTDVYKLKDALRAAGVEFDKIEDKAKAAKNEIKDVSKTGTRDLSALDGVTGGMASKFEDATRSVKSFNTGLKGTKGALISSGIGALVVILGEIIAHWEDIIKFFDKSGKMLEKQITLADQNKTILEGHLNILKSREKLLEAEGKGTEELKKQQIQLLQAIQLVNAEKLKGLETQLLELEATSKEATIWEKILAFRLGVKAKGFVTDEERESIVALQEQILKLKQEVVDTDIAIFNLGKPKSEDSGERQSEGKQSAIDDPESNLEIKGLKDQFDAELELRRIYNDDAASLVAAGQRMQTRHEKENAKARMEIADIEAEAKLRTYQTLGNGLQSLSRLVGEQTTLGKALSVAGTLISTYSSAQKAYESQFLPVPTLSSPIRGAIAAGAAIVSGLANVKAILSVKTPGGIGGNTSFSGSATSQPSVPVQPSFNIVGNSPINQLTESISNIAKAPIEAFVVEKKVTSSQEFARAKTATASLG